MDWLNSGYVDFDAVTNPGIPGYTTAADKFDSITGSLSKLGAKVDEDGNYVITKTVVYTPVAPKKEATTPVQPAAPEQAVVPVPSTPAVKPMDSISS